MADEHELLSWKICHLFSWGLPAYFFTSSGGVEAWSRMRPDYARIGLLTPLQGKGGTRYQAS
eukprot:220835-Hanusia_phi.AAC.1